MMCFIAETSQSHNILKDSRRETPLKLPQLLDEVVVKWAINVAATNKCDWKHKHFNATPLKVRKEYWWYFEDLSDKHGHVFTLYSITTSLKRSNDELIFDCS